MSFVILNFLKALIGLFNNVINLDLRNNLLDNINFNSISVQSLNLNFNSFKRIKNDIFIMNINQLISWCFVGGR